MPSESPALSPAAPSLRTARPEVVEAYLIGQEARLNQALRHAGRGRAVQAQSSTLTVARLTQAAAGTLDGSGPAPEVHTMVARALDTVYQADAHAAGHALGGERLVADLLLKSALGRFKGETTTSLSFLSHHLQTPGMDAAGLMANPAMVRHGHNVAQALRHLAGVGTTLRASGDPEVQARARRADEAQAQLRQHPQWGAAVRVAEQMAPPAEEPAPASDPFPSRRPALR